MQDLVQFSTDNWILVSGFIASGLAVIFYELKLKAQGISSVTTSVAVQLINSGFRVVDVRESEKYAGGHIIDADNVPEAELLAKPDRISKLKKGAVLVCDHGSHSASCAAKLRKQGVEKVFSLKGGLHAWRQENLPVVSDSEGE